MAVLVVNEGAGKRNLCEVSSLPLKPGKAVSAADPFIRRGAAGLSLARLRLLPFPLGDVEP